MALGSSTLDGSGGAGQIGELGPVVLVGSTISPPLSRSFSMAIPDSAQSTNMSL